MSQFFYLCALTVFLSCNKPGQAPVNDPPPALPGPGKTWLALGDSYTIGQGVEAAERFPAQTVNLLRLSGINCSAPYYIATTGWTSQTLISQVESQNLLTYDVVSLLIGVNDQYQTHDTTGYRQRFTWLLEKSIQLTGGRKSNVFVLSIPDYSVTPFAAGNDTARIRQELDWFNAINRQVTQLYQCNYLDITPSTREARYDLSLLAADRLHPSGLEYRKWAMRLAPMVEVVVR